MILSPGQLDVVYGRGKRLENHVGNIQLAILLEDYLPQYNQASKRADKTQTSQAVVDCIERKGGRFLKQVSGVWEIVANKEALEKVSHGFRNLRGKQNTSTSAVVKKRSTPSPVISEQQPTPKSSIPQPQSHSSLTLPDTLDELPLGMVASSSSTLGTSPLDEAALWE